MLQCEQAGRAERKGSILLLQDKERSHLFSCAPMNRCVPDFGVDREHEPILEVSGDANGGDFASAGVDGLAEILWRKGPVFRRFDESLKGGVSPPLMPEATLAEPYEVLMGEDELVSWLQQPVEGGEDDGSTTQWPELGQMPLMDQPKEATGVESNSAPPFIMQMPQPDFRGMVETGGGCEPYARRDSHTDGMVGSSSCWFQEHGGQGKDRIDRKRKACQVGQSDDEVCCSDRKRKACQVGQSDDEVAEQDSVDKRKDAPRQVRRTRAAEVHNLSERRRRDRINEKMKALQQLIPRCNNTDKASMLGDAVDYLKSLQSHIQMISMGCAMPAMMFPGMTHYPQMFMGMGTESTGCRMAWPMLPFPPVMQSPALAGSSATHFSGGMPVQAFQPSILSGGMSLNSQLTGCRTAAPLESTSNISSMQGQNPPQVLNMHSPHFQYFSLQQMPQFHEGHAAAEQPSCKSAITPKNPHGN